MASSHCQAPPPKTESQLLGGPPPGAGSRQRYQSRLALEREARVAEPGMTVRRVIGNEVQDQLQSPRMKGRDQPVEGVEIAEHGIDISVVGAVVAEIPSWRRINRRQPDRVGPEPAQIIETAEKTGDIADAVPVSVHEGRGGDLVDDAALPPEEIVSRFCRRWGHHSSGFLRPHCEWRSCSGLLLRARPR